MSKNQHITKHTYTKKKSNKKKPKQNKTNQKQKEGKKIYEINFLRKAATFVSGSDDNPSEIKRSV